MSIENLSLIQLSHHEANIETLRDMIESFDDFDAVDLEQLLGHLAQEERDV